MDLQLENKVALVTGSNRGTGLVIAKRLAEEGARVLVHGPDAESAEKAAKEIGAAGAVSGAIATDDGASRVADQVHAFSPALDILVNNYGTAEGGRWLTASTADWISIYEKNTLSVVRMVQHFLPAMSEAGRGRIINLGTVGSTRPNRNMPHYYASKGALANLTVSLAKETTGTAITVNLVSPGLIRTPEVEEAWARRAREEGLGNSFEEAESKLVEKYFPNPMGRVATREEVADLVIFLASDRAAFINSQNIRIDGGAVDIV
ncbi:MAG: SDR family oxidoreductase [Pseudomonadales bacterium]|nr:SDR family oxidoreductase [Pseudomonadales bacterium]